MNRNLQSDSIILRIRKAGDFHRVASCLTRDYGLIDVMAYGAGKGKSRLSGLVDPFALLKLYVYHDPVKNSYKITDIEQKRIFPELRTDLDKFYIASFWAETILKSFSGGEPASVYGLLASSLYYLDRAEKQQTDSVLIQFIWRYLGISGFSPDVLYCSGCGLPLTESREVFFGGGEGAFLCGECGSRSMTVIPKGALNYIIHTLDRDLGDSLRVGLDRASEKTLKRISISMVQEIIEYPLNTLKKGLI